MTASVLGSARPRNSLVLLPSARHTRHQEQAFVFQRVGQRRGAVRANDVDALQKAVRRAAVDHLLDDQRADHAGRIRLLRPRRTSLLRRAAP